MARPLRITFPGAFYHITSRGNERKSVFKSKRDREKFLGYLESATQRYGAVIHAYCLMDNHYHLLLETPSGNLPQIMRHINGAYTTYFNVKRDRPGHLFQGRYKAILVESDQYAKELSRYIHLNPVRAKMSEMPEAYDWSSYNYYIGRKKAPEWLFREFILGYFGKNISSAQKEYKEFVSSLVKERYDSPLKDVFGSILLGSPDFIEQIKTRYLSDRKPDKELPALRQLVARISLQDVFNTVGSVFENEPSLERSLIVYLCQKYSGETLKKIGDRFGISESAVSQTAKRFKVKIEKDRRLLKKIERIEKKCKLSKVKI
jgi:putative transposase